MHQPRAHVIWFALSWALGLATALAAQSAPRTYTHDASGNRSAVLNQIRLSAAAGMFVEPERAMAGDKLNLYGRGFPAGQPSQVAVVLGGQAATVLSVSDRVITVQVPTGVVTGPVTLQLSGGSAVTIGTVYVHGVAVTPSIVELDYGQQQQFAATVVGAGSTAVTWSVQDFGGGTSGVGSINAAGLYTAPASSTTPAPPVLVQARSTELGIVGRALVRISCVDRGPIGNRALVTDSLPAGNARVCYTFQAQAQQRVYVALLSAQSVRYLAVRDANGTLIAYTGSGTRLRIPDVLLSVSGSYRIEVQGLTAANPSVQLWVDAHAPHPRGVWMFPADDSWHVADNWSNAQLPQTGDAIVVPDFAGVSLRLAVSQNLAVRSLQCEEGLRLTAGTLTLGDTAAPPPFLVRGGIELVGGTLAGAATVTCEGASLWTGSVLAGSGTLSIAAGGSLALQATSLAMDLRRQLENQGAVTWSSGLLRMNGGTLRNLGTFTATTNSTLTCSSAGGSNLFDNPGTVVKTGSGNVVVSGGTNFTQFQSAGTVDVQGGRWVLQGPANFTDGAVVDGAGAIEVGAGTTTFTGKVGMPGGLVVTGGTASVEGTATVSGSLLMQGGTLSGAGTLRLDGSGVWTGGTMSGSGQTVVGASGALALQATSFAMDLQRLLEVQGAATWSSGLLRLTNGTLRTTGTFTATTASTLTCSGSPGSNVFENQGTVRKLGSGTVALAAGASAVAYQGGGTLDVQAGDFSLGGASSLGDGAIVAGAGDLVLAAATTTFVDNVTVPGNLVVSGGTAQVDGTTTVTGGLRFLSGTVTGSGTLRVDGAGVWTGGIMAGAGQTVIGPGGTLGLQATSFAMDLQRLLEVRGGGTWTSGLLRLNGGTLRTSGSGSFTATTASTLTCTGSAGSNLFDNQGTTIKNGAGTVVFAAGSNGVAFASAGTVDVQAGTLMVAAGGSITDGAVVAGSGDFDLASGTTTLTGNVSVPGRLVVSGGTAAVEGNTAVAGAFRLGSGTLAGGGTLRVDGSGVWTGGVMSGSGQTVVGGSGSLSLQATSFAMDLQRILEVQGAATWTTGLLRLNGGTLRNAGTFSVNTGSTLTCASSGGVNVFDNTGTLVKVGTGTVVFAASVNGVRLLSTGTVDVQVGTVQVAAGGALGPGGTVAGAATLELAAGTVDVDGTVTVSGHLRLDGATLAVAGTLDVPGNLVAASGTLSGAGTVQIGGTGSWSGGTMSGAGQTVVVPGGSFALLSSPFAMDLQRLFDNQGALTWTGGNLRCNGGTLRNSGTWTMNSASTLNVTSIGTGSNLVQNEAAGTLVKQGSGTAVLSAAVPLSSQGTIDVQAGVLSLTGGGALGPGGSVGGAGALACSGGTFAVTGIATVAPGGTLRASGATLGVAGTLQVDGTLQHSAGVIDGNGTVQVDGTLTWSGGAHAGSGLTRVGAAGTLVVTSSATAIDLQRVLELQGTGTWNTGAIRFTTGTFRNLGTLTVAPASAVSCSGLTSGPNLFDNQGTLSKQGAGSLSFGGGALGVALANSGTVEVVAGSLACAGPLQQTAGFLRLLGGSLSASAGLALDGGVLEGTGTITGNVTNAATVRPAGSGAPGVLSVNGTWTQTVAGVLEIEVGGTTVGTEFDRLSVSGVATHAGSLSVALLGAFTPAPPQTFDVVLHAATSTGAMTCTNCSPTFTVNHLATSVRLVAQ